MKGEMDEDAILSGLGQNFEGENAVVKPYPCCGIVHPFIDAALDLRSEHGIGPDMVEKIVVRHGEGSGLLIYPLEPKQNPRSSVDCQFSIPWVVAAALAQGRASLAEFSVEATRDARILSLSNLVEPEMDAGMSRTEGLEDGALEIHLKGGKVVSCQRPNRMAPEFGRISFDECAQKFMSCAAFSPRDIPEAELHKIVDGIRGLEAEEDAIELIRLLA